MSAGQRSILSFFSGSNSSSSSSSNTPAKQPQLIAPRPAPAAAAAASLPSPPPTFGKFVLPPGSNGPPKPPPGMKLVSGGSRPASDLPAVTAAFSQDVLIAAGAAETADQNQGQDRDLVFPGPRAGSSVVRLVALRPAHIPDLVSVNAILLSVRYTDSFYKHVADRTRPSSLFNRALVDASDPAKPKVVGGVICRLEASPFADPLSYKTELAIYVQSLGLLSPFRGRGWAAAALDSLVAAAVALNATGRLPPVRALYAHVWTESADALHWYEARGFARQGSAPIAGYYHALRPDTAWIVRRDIGPADAVRAATASAAPTQAAAAPTIVTAGAAAAARPGPMSPLSFQNARPETEWNDLPAEMMTASASASAPASASASAASSRNVSRHASTRNLVADAGPPAGGPPAGPPAGPPNGSSQASSRSSSAARKKRDRTYPAAMYGQK